MQASERTVGEGRQRLGCWSRSSVTEARRGVHESRGSDPALGLHRVLSRCWRSPSGWRPDDVSPSRAVRGGRQPGVGRGRHDRAPHRPSDHRGGVAALAHARGWGLLGAHGVSADLVGCRPLGGRAGSRDLPPAPAVSRGAGALATAPGASHGPGARCDHRRCASTRSRCCSPWGSRREWSRSSGHRSWRSSCSRSCSMPARSSATPTCGYRATVDGLLRAVLVTPDMHRVHHSADPTETNTNFGFTFSWWDRLFGTYRRQPKSGHDAMAIGVEGFAGPRGSEPVSLVDPAPSECPSSLTFQSLEGLSRAAGGRVR